MTKEEKNSREQKASISILSISIIVFLYFAVIILLSKLNYDAQLLDNLNFSTIVNQNDLKSDRIKIYPNPAHDKIYFSNVEENIYKGELINLDGKKLKSFQVSSRNQTIDINDLANGMYILKLISNSKKTEEFSFIKQSN